MTKTLLKQFINETLATSSPLNAYWNDRIEPLRPTDKVIQDSVDSKWATLVVACQPTSASDDAVIIYIDRVDLEENSEKAYSYDDFAAIYEEAFTVGSGKGFSDWTEAYDGGGFPLHLTLDQIEKIWLHCDVSGGEYDEEV